MGWTWGYGPSGAYCNLIECNEVFNIAVNGWMNDLGGTYMLGVSPGTILRNNVIVNNIFAHYVTGLVVGKDERPDVSLLVERNIFYSDHSEILRDWQGQDGCVYRGNLYWGVDGVLFNGKSHEAWREVSHDVGSVVADPLFADPEGGDFALDPGSPARALGLVPFDVSGVGPRAPPGASGAPSGERPR